MQIEMQAENEVLSKLAHFNIWPLYLSMQAHSNLFNFQISQITAQTYFLSDKFWNIF